MTEPLYIARPNIRRVVLVDALKTLILCAVFYAAILLNIQLLRTYTLLSSDPPFSIYLAIGGVLLLLFILEMLTVYRKYTIVVYDIYPDRIEAYSKQLEAIPLMNVTDVRLKRNVFDYVFDTGTIIFQPALRMEHIPSPNDVFPYIQRLVAQNKSMMSQEYGRPAYGTPSTQNAPSQYQQYPSS